MPPNGVYGFPDNHFITSLKDTVEAKRKTGGLLDSNSFEKDELRPLVRQDSVITVQFGKRCASIVGKMGSFGMDSHELLHISGMCVNHITDDIVVADCSLNKIVMFSMAGHYRGGFVCDCSIRDVAITGNGNILLSVSRAGSAILREYKIDGTLLASYGSFHKYENPFGLTITSRGKVIITSLQYNTINVFTERKKPSTKFGSRGCGPNHFMLPYYTTVNSRDDIIVTDSGNHRIKVHKNDGSIERTFGGQGSKKGELFYPMGVCTDMYDNIYVADANNFRVQMFSSSGEYLACPVSDTFEFGIDVKPVNVLVVKKKLFVSFRGTKFAEIHEYLWDAAPYRASIQSNKSSGLFCCCKQSSMTYDEI